MNRLESITKPLLWFMALLLLVLEAGCGSGGGQSPIFGSSSIVGLAPVATAVLPVPKSTVATSTKIIQVVFSKAMAPATITPANFTLDCVAAGGAITTMAGGAVTYPDAFNAVLTLPGAPNLPPSAVCTAKVTAAATDTTVPGKPLAADFTWSFATALTPDTTLPKVALTFPADAASGVSASTSIMAIFTKDMAAATITPANFSLACASCVVASPTGSVTYDGPSRTARFTPTTPAVLEVGKTYTATIKGGIGGVTDAVIPANLLGGDVGHPLVAGNYVWTFTTLASAPAVPVTVASLAIAGSPAVCPSATIKALFTASPGLRMDPSTVNTTTFMVNNTTVPATPVAVQGAVALDVLTGLTATFTPRLPLINGQTYTATIKANVPVGPPIVAGVKDTATPVADTLALDYSWSFTAGPATGVCLAPVQLGWISPFGIAATAGITNTVTAPITHIEGDVVLDPTATCNAVAVDAAGGFGLCGSNGSTPTINGIVISPGFNVGVTSTAIKADLLAAFLSVTPPAGPPAAGSLGGATPIAAPTTLGGAVGLVLTPGVNYFTPGVYQSITSILITGDLTLDALGNPDAVFVFQSSSTIDTAAGAPTPGIRTRILLVNGAKASNIWWQAGTSATLGAYSEFQGNILSSASITMVTGATSCGRLLAGAFTAGAFVFDANVVSVPGHPFAPPATYSTICQ